MTLVARRGIVPGEEVGGFRLSQGRLLHRTHRGRRIGAARRTSSWELRQLAGQRQLRGGSAPTGGAARAHPSGWVAYLPGVTRHLHNQARRMGVMVLDTSGQTLEESLDTIEREMRGSFSRLHHFTFLRRDMAYLERLSRAVIDSMSPGLVGLYLHGSLALDDFVAGKSDIDLCAVVPELRDEQRQRLVDAVSPGTMPLEGGGFDLHVVTLDTARTAGSAPVREMWVAAHPGWEFHVEGRAADHDMYLAFEMCRRHGRALRGLDAKEVFAPADRAALLAASEQEIVQWLSYESITQWDSGVLSACRAWWLLEEDELGSKASAGRWALSKGFRAVEQAIEHRAGGHAAIPSQGAIRELLLHVRGLLEDSLLAGAAGPDR